MSYFSCYGCCALYFTQMNVTWVLSVRKHHFLHCPLSKTKNPSATVGYFKNIVSSRGVELFSPHTQCAIGNNLFSRLVEKGTEHCKITSCTFQLKLRV